MSAVYHLELIDAASGNCFADFDRDLGIAPPRIGERLDLLRVPAAHELGLTDARVVDVVHDLDGHRNDGGPLLLKIYVSPADAPDRMGRQGDIVTRRGITKG